VLFCPCTELYKLTKALMVPAGRMGGFDAVVILSESLLVLFFTMLFFSVAVVILPHILVLNIPVIQIQIGQFSRLGNCPCFLIPLLQGDCNSLSFN
jgi:hypothetical protein